MRRAADRSCGDGFGGAVPVVHGNRDEGRPARRLHGDVIRPCDRGRHVFAAGGLAAPLDVGFRQPRRLGGKEKRLVGKNRARLLAGGDDQRRPVPVGREDVAHRVADAGRRVQVDERGVARGLRVAVGHADDDRFLQAEDVAEIVRELAEERQLGRAGVAEDGGHPQLAQQADNGFAYGGHRGAHYGRRALGISSPPMQQVPLYSPEDAHDEIHARNGGHNGDAANAERIRAQRNTAS